MTGQGPDPARVFAALADPTRRRIVDWLAAGDSGTATEFAARLPISRQAVVKHLAEMAAAGLIVGARQGKQMRYQLQPGALAAAAGWLTERADRWDRALRSLARFVERPAPEDAGNDTV